MSNAEALDLPAVAQEGLGRDFYLIWLGQAISMIGTQLTGFAFSVWTAKAMEDYTLYILVATLPALLLLPWSGGFADRHDRKTILVCCEVAAMLSMAILAVLAYQHALALWHIYVIQAVLSVSAAFQGPAAKAAIVSIIPKSQLGRAGGMWGLTSALTQFGGPFLASGLLVAIGMRGIVAIDMASYTFALLGLCVATIPAIVRVAPAEESAAPPRKHPFGDLMWSIHFLRERPAMALTYAYTSLGGFLSNIVLFLAVPTVIASYSQAALPWVTAAGAVGMLLSGLLLVVWGGPKKWTPLLLGFSLLAGIAIMVAGAWRSIYVLCACALIVMLCTEALSACMQSVWQRKIPKEAQGRFAAFQQIVAMGLLPLSAVVASALYAVAGPAMQTGGALEAAGRLFGNDPAGRYAALFCLAGFAGVVVSVLALAHRRLYRLEAEVADAF